MPLSTTRLLPETARFVHFDSIISFRKILPSADSLIATDNRSGTVQHVIIIHASKIVWMLVQPRLKQCRFLQLCSCAHFVNAARPLSC